MPTARDDPERNRRAPRKESLGLSDADSPYLGYEIWNRQRRDEVLIDVHDVALGHETRMRWNDKASWIRSREQTHEALITQQQWDAVTAIFAGRQRAPLARVPLAGRHYVLAGLVRCGDWEGSWNHNKAHYRCQLRREDAVDRGDHPRTVYLKEAVILPHVDAWVAELFDDDRIDHTAELLAAATEPDPDEALRRRETQDRIAKLGDEIEAYRILVREQPVTAREVGKWIAETVQEKTRLENLLGLEPTTKLTAGDVKAMLASLRSITLSLALADPDIKAAAYADLGISVTYHADGRALLESRPRISGVAGVGVGGGT